MPYRIFFSEFNDRLLERKYNEKMTKLTFESLKEFTLTIIITFTIRAVTYLMSDVEGREKKALLIFFMVFLSISVYFLANYSVRKQNGQLLKIIILLYCTLILFLSIKQISTIQNDYARGFTFTLFPLLLIYQSMYLLRNIKLSLLSFILFGIAYFQNNTFQEEGLLKECIIKYSSFVCFFLLFVHRYEKELRTSFHIKSKTKIKMNMHHQFLQSLKDPAFIISQKKEILFQNESTIQLFGESKNWSEFQNHLSSVISNEKRDLWSFIREGFSVIEAEECKTITQAEFKFARKEIDKVFMVSIIGAGLFQKEGSVAVLMMDVTQKLELEEIRIADGYKRVLLCTFSHELRTPLNGIMGMLRILKKGSRGKIRKNLLIALASSHFLHSKINDILDYFQIMNNANKLHPSLFDIHKFCKKLNSICLPTIENSKVKFEFNISPLLPVFIKADSERLQQILLNLLGNAIKFTYQGFILFKIKNTEEGDVKFIVRDSGIGMKDSQIQNLFKLSFLDKNAEKSTLAGLGLKVSQALCKEMGSELTVKSTENAGSKFCFSLPANSQNNLEGEEESRSLNQSLNDTIRLEENDLMLKPELLSKREKIRKENLELNEEENFVHLTTEGMEVPEEFLTKRIELMDVWKDNQMIFIVDDNQTNRFVLKKLLKKNGFVSRQLTECCNGKEVVDLMAERVHLRNPVLIFMDIEMPILNGIQATEQIKSFISNSYPITICAVTAFSCEKERAKCFDAGMNHFMTKPVTNDKIKEILDLISFR